MKKNHNMFSITFILFFLLIGLSHAAEPRIETPVSIRVLGNINGDLMCIASCGSCCTAQTVSDQSQSLTLNVGSSDIELKPYYNDNSTHWVSGYYYQTSGSCDMGSCSLFHVTSVDKVTTPDYSEQSQVLTIPNVSASGKNYAVTVNGPHDIANATEIVGQSQDCSSGQNCAEGYTCVTYTGISGAEFKGCEISCINKSACPHGKSCINISDGPQNVCQ